MELGGRRAGRNAAQGPPTRRGASPRGITVPTRDCRAVLWDCRAVEQTCLAAQLCCDRGQQPWY